MDLLFGLFYRYATQRVAPEARHGPLIVPQMVLEYSHRAATFRDFRGEASGSPSLARSDLAVPNQGPRRGAFATRHKPLDRSPSNGSATIEDL